MMAINPVASKGWLDIMSESARFIADRLQQDLNAQKAMLACKTPAELLQVQSEFYKSAMEQYTEEYTRLYKMMSAATDDTLNDARSGHCPQLRRHTALSTGALMAFLCRDSEMPARHYVLFNRHNIAP